MLRGLRRAVATGSEPIIYEPCLERTHILGLFDSFTTLSEVSRGKGHPDVYLRAAEKLGLAPQECAVFEDLLTGIRGARAGGFYTVGVADEASRDNEKSIRAEADAWIADYREALADCGADRSK